MRSTPNTGARPSHVERKEGTTDLIIISILTQCNSCVAVKQLPLGTDVEIECIAVLP